MLKKEQEWELKSTDVLEVEIPKELTERVDKIKKDFRLLIA